MAEKEEFYERQIDRTPYQAFWYVGVGLLLVLVPLTYAVLILGTTLRHTKLPTLPVFSTPNPKALLDSARQSANNEVQQAADQAATKAADNTTHKINQFLHP